MLILIALIGVLFLGLIFKQKEFRLAAETQESVLSRSKKTFIFFENWIFAAIIFLQIGVEGSLSGWLPSYAKRFTDAEMWLIVPLVYWTGFLLSRLLSSVFLESMSEKNLVLSGLILVIIGQIMIISNENLALISVGALFTGFGTAPIFPTTIALASAKFENDAPELINYLFFLSSLSGIFFLWLIGFISSKTNDLKTAFWIPIICSLILLLLCWLKFYLKKKLNNKSCDSQQI